MWLSAKSRDVFGTTEHNATMYTEIFGYKYERRGFGKSDHDSILLLSTYRQKLKQETPMLKSVQRWSDQSDSTLQDCFDHMDWDMFRIASDNNIDVYADSVSELISKCIRDVVPTVVPTL
jgi:hypothetical protein